jgi:ATP-dependent Clp protease ATP-binding subunit ClpA
VNFNFTDGVRKVLSRAREEAIRLQHGHVDDGHLLLGLLRERDGIASTVRADLSLESEAVRESVERAMGRGTSTVTRGELPYTSAAKRALEFSMAEAREHQHSYVGTEHLQLGLLRESTGTAAKVFNNLGVTYEIAQRQTLKRLADPKSADPVAAAFEEVIVVHTSTGDTFRVLETEGPSAREFAERICRRGVWITGNQTFFIPPIAITRVQVFTPEEWGKVGW